MRKRVPHERASELATFFRMAREFPVRTGIFSFGLPVFALLQLVNGIVYDGSLPAIAIFAVVMVVYSVQITRYHVAAYRRKRLAYSMGW